MNRGLFATIRRLVAEVGLTRADSPSARRPPAAAHLASAGLPVLLALLWPAQALAQAPPAVVVAYYYLDALGSVRVVTDQNGQILKNAAGVEVGRHDFLPFGEEWNPPANAKEKKLFTSHERDTDTGLDYFGARYYRPQVGRFTTVDPVYTWSENLTDPQRWNRYAYVRNNPLRWVDPDGRMPVPLITGALGSAIYVAWNAYVNVQNGREWWQNWGVEAGRGFAIGATVGLTAPALTSLTQQAGTVAAVAASPSPLRRQYAEAVESLSERAAEMRAAGRSSESIARALHAARRAIGVQFKDMTPPELRGQIYARNMKLYGDRLGPSIDWLRMQGKSWEAIINSATRVGGKDMGF